MFLKLEELCETKNVISLGGNQCYYKVIWSENFTKVECRKDGTWHDNTIMPGGTWASSLTTEARLLGVRYSDAGYGTYMPYKITNDEHWMFHGLESIKKRTYIW